MATNDKTVRMWRTVGGERLLTELRPSMFGSEDDFQRALAFHHERGCESEEDTVVEACGEAVQGGERC